MMMGPFSPGMNGICMTLRVKSFVLLHSKIPVQPCFLFDAADS